jgi:hypothetical protein
MSNATPRSSGLILNFSEAVSRQLGGNRSPHWGVVDGCDDSPVNTYASILRSRASLSLGKRRVSGLNVDLEEVIHMLDTGLRIST